jgi:hypothetical protein
MTKHLNWDKAVAAASWVIVFVLFYGVYFVLTQDLNPNNFVVQSLGVLGTRILFATLYLAQASLLSYSKWKKKDRMRRHVLLFIYLTGFFLSVLSFSLNGFTIRVLSNVVLSVCAAVCWLYWKFRTDYYSVEHGHEYMKLREDESKTGT